MSVFDLIRTEDVKVARLFALSAHCLYAVALFFVKKCKGDYLTVSFLRGTINILIIMTRNHFDKEDLFKSKIHVDWMLLRGFIGIFPALTTVMASKYVKISIFAVFGRFQMIVVFFAGIYFLGNRFDYRILIAAACSITGVILVVAPGVFHLSTDSKDKLEMDFTPREIIGLIICVLWLFADSAGIIVTSKAMRFINVSQAVFALNLFIGVSSGLLLSLKGAPTYFLEDLIPVIVLSFSYYIAQMLQTEGLRVDKNVGVQAILSSFFLISCLIMDCIFNGVSVSLPNLVGCVIVTASSVWAVQLREQNKAIVNTDSGKLTINE